MSGTNDILDIVQVLGAEAPPADFQRISRRIDPRDKGSHELHAADCVRLQKELVTQELTGGTLCSWLGGSNWMETCGYCHGDDRAMTNMLLRALKIRSLRTAGASWVTAGLMLHYEAWKPGYVDEWCLWSCGQTAAEIRENARNRVEWDPETEEPRAAVFGISREDETMWVMAAGDHVCTRKTSVLGGCHIRVHGIAPVEIANWQKRQDAGIVVEVDKTFTKTHLNLAVTLFEDGMNLRKNGRENDEQIAQVAVETAMLALG